MYHKHWIALVTVLLAALMLSPAFAGGAAGGFKALDADADGYISQQEAAASQGLSDAYSSVDQNQDGKLDSAEFSAFETEMKSAPEAPKTSD
jgi:Ca2+-binding EF-hand superfamily protein